MIERRKGMHDSIEFKSLEKKVGQFIEYWVFKDIEGRIWLNIFTSKDGLCAKDLMSRLKISKSLVSISIQVLLDYNVIRKREEKFQGMQYYVAEKNIRKVITDVLRKRERKMLAEVILDVELLKTACEKEEHDLDLSKVNYIKNMTKVSQKILDILVFPHKSNPLNFEFENNE